MPETTATATATNGLSARRRGSARRPGPDFGLPEGWWPVAFGSEVTTSPLAARLGRQQLCLYREPAGAVRAVLDLCPHRRLPLSLGSLTPEGHLQCPYHGWCFDGASGRCTAIPNLAPDERVSPSIRVAAFATAERARQRLAAGGRGGSHRHGQAVGAPPPELAEQDALTTVGAMVQDGFVHVWTGSSPTGAGEEPGRGPEPERGWAARGAVPGVRATVESAVLEVRSPYRQVAEALLTHPGRALGLGLLLGAGEEVVRPDADVRHGAVVVTRERRVLDVPRVRTFEPHGRRTVRTTISTAVTTGTTVVEVEGEVPLRVVIGLTPIAGHRTVVRWWAERDGRPRTAWLVHRLSRSARRVAGHGPAPLHAVADDIPLTDPAVERLRAARAPRPNPEEGR